MGGCFTLVESFLLLILLFCLVPAYRMMVGIFLERRDTDARETLSELVKGNKFQMFY